MVVRAGIDQEEIESFDLKKKEVVCRILRFGFRTFFNFHSILHLQFFHLNVFFSLLV